MKSIDGQLILFVVAFHMSHHIRFIAQNGVTHAHTLSFLGQNVLFCMRRYNCSLQDVLYGSVDSIVKSFVFM